MSADPAPAIDEPVRPSPALLEAVRGDLDTLAGDRRRVGLRFALFATAVAAGWGLLMGARTPTGALWWITLVAMVAGGLTLLALAGGLRFASTRVLRWAGVGALVGLSALMLLTALTSETFDEAGRSTTLGMMCSAQGVMISLLLIVTLLIAMRRLLRRHAPVALLVGAGTGLLGSVPLHLHCPYNSVHHLLGWHGCVPLLAIGMAGLAWAWVRAGDPT